MSKSLRNTLALAAFVAILLCMASNHFQQTSAQQTQASFTWQSATPSPAQQPHTLVRISQLDPAQYATKGEFDTWAYSACSTAAMVEVFNFYGHSYRIHDVLLVQARINEITPALGLVEDAGIARSAAHFGFTTSWGYNLTYQQVIATANAGTPVIVSWPPSRYNGGHLVVVTGGNDASVFLADSSIWNRHVISRAQFLRWWAGFSAVVKPAA